MMNLSGLESGVCVFFFFFKKFKGESE